MKSKLRSKFKGPFLVMYAVALVIWQNFLNYLSFFTAFDAAYSEETAANAVKAIDAARLLPDASTRRAVSKNLRKLLRAAGKKCCNNFQVLLVYIEKSFPPAEVAAMKQAAGSDNYLKAGRGKLTTLIALNTAAATFIETNSDTLTAGGMPAAFAATVNSAVADFNKLNTAYTTAIQTEREETNAKTTADNAVYTTLINMLKDAKVIFISDAVKRAFFTYDVIALRFKKEGKTGYRFTLRQQGSNAPVAGAVVVFQPGNITAVSGKNGAAEAVLQKDIVYSYTITAPGFGTLTGTGLKPVAGIVKRLEFNLNSIAKAMDS